MLYVIYILIVSTSFLLPILIGCYYWREKEQFSSFRLGVFCFIITQVILRPIFLYVVGILYPPMQKLVESSVFDSILVVILAALSAALFEEIGRYVVWKKRRNDVPSYQDAIAFGLGHGGCEAVLALGLPLFLSIFGWVKAEIPTELNLTSLGQIINRPIALMVHTVLTLIVFYGIKKGKKEWVFVLLAILLHFVLNLTGGILRLYAEYSHFWTSPHITLLLYLCHLMIVLMIFFYIRNLYITKNHAVSHSKGI